MKICEEAREAKAKMAHDHAYQSMWSFMNSRAQREKVLKVDRLGEKQPAVINILKLIAVGDAQNRKQVN